MFYRNFDLINSNGDVPQEIFRKMAKSCNGTKSFKQRNPDLNLEEIQNNPNIPDDVKAVLNESALKQADDDYVNKGVIEEEEEEEVEEEAYETADLKTTKDILAYMDDGRWFASIVFF